jgi:hypothetical protein
MDTHTYCILCQIRPNFLFIFEITVAQHILQLLKTQVHVYLTYILYILFYWAISIAGLSNSRIYSTPVHGITLVGPHLDMERVAYMLRFNWSAYCIKA